MRICIPTEDEQGLGGRLAAHFGRAPYYTVVDEATGAVKSVANSHAVHEHGGCAPTSLVTGEGLEAVICRGLGRGAHARLTAVGVRVYLSDAADVAGALADWRAGRVQEVMSEQLCCGHGHGHEHGHGPGHGPGH
jgi:predicted Fe-Mo cluster-binding NifX family protein